MRPCVELQLVDEVENKCSHKCSISCSVSLVCFVCLFVCLLPFLSKRWRNMFGFKQSVTCSDRFVLLLKNYFLKTCR